MGTKSPGGSQRCQLILHNCLAIELCKSGHTPEDFWMYDSGYMLFQNFLAANAQCWWNIPLTTAIQTLKYAGHVSPGMLLVTGEPCALEVVRGSYARGVLKPPVTYMISAVGDIDDCIVTPTIQGQFTPLSEALCDIIMDLTTKGQYATIEHLKKNLGTSFPHITTPKTEVIYDTLVQLMQEKKIYQTSKGYFIVTPERRRSRSRSKTHYINNLQNKDLDYQQIEAEEARTLLMTNVEAVHSLYGEICTERDGDLTHQCIQTNLADVLCGGNPHDKIMYATSKRRSASFPTPRSLERRHSLRLFGSSKRLQRCTSTRSLSKAYAQSLATDSSSSECQSTDSSSPRKGSLLFRLFRRSGRSKQRRVETYAGQFPPLDWFNSRTVHLNSIGTQTIEQEISKDSFSNSTFYDGYDVIQRSSTLPKCRHVSNDSTNLLSSRDSPLRRNSHAYSSSSLPRSIKSISATSNGNTVQNVNRSVNGPQQLQNSSNICRNNTSTYRTSLPKKYETINEEAYKKYLYKDCLKLSTNKLGNSDSFNGKALQQSNRLSSKNGIKSSNSYYNPSNTESEKNSYNKLNDSSSPDTQFTTATEHHQFSNRSPVRSLLILNHSPRSSPNRRHLINNSSTGSIKTETSKMEKSARTSLKLDGKHSVKLKETSKISDSIIPGKQIFDQNSPRTSVISLENRKFVDSANVFIINKKTIYNERDELKQICFSRPNLTPSKISQCTLKLSSTLENDKNAELFRTRSIIPHASKIETVTFSNKLDSSKLSNNMNNGVTMNNGKMFYQILPNSGSKGIVYKNFLKDNLISLENTEECVFEFGKASSVDNLGFYEKNLNDVNSKINALNDFKNFKFESMSNLNTKSLVCTSVDTLANILQKNKIDISSEPNLSLKNMEQRIKNGNYEKIIGKNMKDIDKGFISLKEANEELYDFPSLTDLSFNFTSLAAKKILEGVSLSSMNTLVELNFSQGNEKEKQQNNNFSTE